jgi:hypothetical protein
MIFPKRQNDGLGALRGAWNALILMMIAAILIYIIIRIL